MGSKGKYVIAALAGVVVVLLVVVAFLLGQRSGQNTDTTSAPSNIAEQSSVSENTSSATDSQDSFSSDDWEDNTSEQDNTFEQDISSQNEQTPSDLQDQDIPRNLDISMTAGSLTFVSGSEFNVDYNSSVINVTTSGDTMTIKNDHSHPSASERKKMDVTVTVPDPYSFGSVDIEFGAGKLIVHSLSSNDLSMELGAGSANFDNINVTGSADIKEGAGELVISNGSIANLDLKCGAGATRVACALTGSSNVTAAVGAVDIDLKGSESDYGVSFQIGLGACYYNGEKLSRSGSYGSGENTVNITGGFGVMRVNAGR